MYHQTNPPTVTTPKFRVRKPEDYVEEALILRTETKLCLKIAVWGYKELEVKTKLWQFQTNVYTDDNISNKKPPIHNRFIWSTRSSLHDVLVRLVET